MGLVLCATCMRHVRRREHVCPFCGAELGQSNGGPRALTAAVMIGLGLAVGACGGDTTEAGVGDGGGLAGAGGASGATAVPLYAAVAPDSGAATGGGGSGGGAVALYAATPLYAAVAPDSGSGAGGVVYIYAALPRGN
jgi:hypothetical protein